MELEYLFDNWEEIGRNENLTGYVELPGETGADKLKKTNAHADFRGWLESEMFGSETVDEFVASINYISSYIRQVGYSPSNLCDIRNFETLKSIYKRLAKNKAFREYDSKMGNRYLDAFDLYLEFHAETNNIPYSGNPLDDESSEKSERGPVWGLNDSAVLLDGCMRYAEQEETLLGAIRYVSESLRKMAERDGRKIGSDYCNGTYVWRHMKLMIGAFLNKPIEYPLVFRNVSNIYKSNRPLFLESLSYAITGSVNANNDKPESTPVKTKKPEEIAVRGKRPVPDDNFRAWMDESGDRHAEEHAALLKSIREFAQENDIVHYGSDPFDGDDAEAVSEFVNDLKSSAEFKGLDSGMRDAYVSALDEYVKYLEGLPEPESATKPKRRSGWPWDLHESVILLDGVLAWLDGSRKHYDIVEDVSEKLRRMGMNRGRRVDESYRSRAEISVQIRNMREIHERKSVEGCEKFKEAHDIYETNRPRYNVLLSRANSECVTTTKEEVAGSTDEKVSGTDKDKNSGNKQKFVKGDGKIPQTGFDGVNDGNPLRDAVLVEKNQGGLEYVLEFDNLDPILLNGSAPVSISYRGEEYDTESWSDVYVIFLRCVYEDFPEVIDKLCRRVVSEASYVHIYTTSNGLPAYRRIGESPYYVNTSLSAEGVCRRIGMVTSLCAIDNSEIKVRYTCKSEREDEPYVRKTGYGRSTPKDISVMPDEDGKKNKRQPIWDISEAVILLDGVMKSTNGGNRHGITKDISRKLRQMAINRGLDIDDVYRNVAGIEMQFSRMKAIFYDEPARAPHKIFEEAIRVYRHDRVRYDEILAAALKECEVPSGDGREASTVDEVAHGGYKSTLGDEAEAPKEHATTSNVDEPALDGTEIHDETLYFYSTKSHRYRCVAYEKILKEYFKKGFRTADAVELNRFINHYTNVYGAAPEVSDDKLENDIQNLCVEYDGRAYLPEVLLDDDGRDKLLGYIDASLNGGVPFIHYEALCDKFKEEFLSFPLYDNPELLWKYLKTMDNRDFYVDERGISRHAGDSYNPDSEIKACVRKFGRPVSADEVREVLPYISRDMIKTVLTNPKDDEILNNGNGEYFHIDIVYLSDDDINDVSGIIDTYIQESRYVSNNELYQDIERTFPSIWENIQVVSMHGFLNVLKVRLRDEFSFKGNIISAPEDNISSKDIFGDYAGGHDGFMLSELEALSEDLSMAICWPAVYENSVRVDGDHFVTEKRVKFDVKKIDEALDSVCDGGYAPLKKIKNFNLFPYTGFQWTPYLLESYVNRFSREYRLMHTGYGKECCGAVVKWSAGIDSMDELILRVLLDSDIEMNKEPVLSFLVDEGYIAVRRYTNIEEIIGRVRVNKGKRG